MRKAKQVHDDKIIIETKDSFKKCMQYEGENSSLQFIIAVSNSTKPLVVPNIMKPTKKCQVKSLGWTQMMYGI
jgi:hypothetical protein